MCWRMTISLTAAENRRQVGSAMQRILAREADAIIVCPPAAQKRRDERRARPQFGHWSTSTTPFLLGRSTTGPGFRSARTLGAVTIPRNTVGQVSSGADTCAPPRTDARRSQRGTLDSSGIQGGPRPALRRDFHCRGSNRADSGVVLQALPETIVCVGQRTKARHGRARERPRSLRERQ